MDFTLDKALIEVQKLSRQRGFPVDADGVEDLARGLMKACAKGVTVDALIAAAKEASAFCPTDYDLLQLADSLRPPDPAWRVDTRRCPVGVCDGTGWVRVFALISTERNGDGTVYTRKQKITEQQYNSLRAKIDHRTQEVYDGVKRCKCSAPRKVEGES